MKPNRKNLLVRNEAQTPPEVKKLDLIQSFTINLLPKLARLANLEGREHVVVPMVMMTEGVHSGSGGPLLYLGEDLGKTPESWDHKPVVVYHPTQNGKGISACSPDVINTQKIGIILNSKYDKKGRLKSEAWIERNRADLVDPRIMKAIDNSEMMEVSTGVFVDMEPTEGKWNKEEYDGIARNFRPDHLAILPDQIGACSIADGAGLMRNSTTGPERMKEQLKDGKLVGNEMSFDNIRSSLCDALRVKFGVTMDSTGPYVWVADVYDEFVVYEHGSKLFRISYTASDTGVSLGSETPAEVKRVTEYRTVDGFAYVGNRDQHKETPQMNKKQLIDGIVGNGGWSEANRTSLDAMDEATLTIIKNSLTAPAPAPAKVEAKTESVANARPEPAPERKIVTINDYLADAPPGISAVLKNSMAVYEAEKSRLVGIVLGNKKNEFTKEQLNEFEMPTLKSLAALAAEPAVEGTRVALYGGQGSVTDNSQSAEEPLVLPVWNAAKK